LGTYYKNKIFFHAAWCLQVGMKVIYENIIFELWKNGKKDEGHICLSIQ